MGDETNTPAPAAKAASDQQPPRGRPFPKGVSGNPSGKAPGTKNRATRILEALLDGEAETVTRAVVEKAKGGELAAAKMVLDRILPPPKDRPVPLALPRLQTAADALKAMTTDRERAH